MEKSYLLITALLSCFAFGQVGINIDAPSTTMDVRAKRNTDGTMYGNTQLVGLQAPRFTRDELKNNTSSYGVQQKGALIYITDVSGGDTNSPRTNIDAEGYYFFDGTLWQKM